MNTDARTLANVTPGQEYAKLHETFGWDASGFYRCNKNTLEAAFVPDDVPDRLLTRLAEGYRLDNP